MAAASDILVIGAGAVGLSLAWRLRQRGATVTVLEQGPIFGWPGPAAYEGQATWASAGLLAPAAECSRQSRLGELGRASLAMYPEFVDDLCARSGHPLALQGPGLLRLARGSDEAAALRTSFCEHDCPDLPLEWIETPAQIEPALDAEIGPAILCRAERHIPPRELLLALVKACANEGVRLQDHTTATGFRVHDGRILGVATSVGEWAGDQVVIAAGCWSGDLARTLGFELPVRPVRGQILALRCALLLTYAIYTPRGYLVPRADGQLVVGATEESVGFRSSVTAEGVHDLLEFATDLVPALAVTRFDSAWAGLRPASPDGLPVLGPAPGYENLHLAAGHFRNGILLTPVTASLMTEWVLDRRSHPLLDASQLNRFGVPA